MHRKRPPFALLARVFTLLLVAVGMTFVVTQVGADADGPGTGSLTAADQAARDDAARDDAANDTSRSADRTEPVPTALSEALNTQAAVAAEAAKEKAAERAAAEAAAKKAAAKKAADEAAAKKAAEEAAAKKAAEEEAARKRAEEKAAYEAAVAGAVSDPKSAARAMIADYGWGGDQFECLDLLWTRESDWTYTATNPSSGAYGIPQSLPGDKMASAGDDWRTNPVTQIRWGLGYIDERYGTPCSAWGHSEATGWY